MFRWLPTCLLAVIIGSLLFAAPEGMTLAAAAQTTQVSINWDPKEAPANESALWLGYLLARANYINAHPTLYPQHTGSVLPTFTEEVEARSSAARIYTELKAKDPTLNVAYFDDLALISSNSFMSEYVWTYLRQDTWGTAPAGLKLTEFDEWRAAHLAGHHAISHGTISYNSAVKASIVRPEEPGKEWKTLAEGRKVLQSGNPQQAIRGYFDPVISGFESMHKDSKVAIYSAQNQQQAIIYSALPTIPNQSIEVLGGEWADAYLMKAYALTELKKVSEAQAALGRAIELSPMNSQYIAELAYTYQALGDCDRSIVEYVRSAEMAEIGSDESTKTVDLTRAWRGQGYCLVEQGKFAEAEALYRKCLSLDPNDKRAMGELNYVLAHKSR